MRATGGRTVPRVLALFALALAALFIWAGCGTEPPVVYVTHVVETPEGTTLQLPVTYPERAVMAVARHRPSGTVRILRIEAVFRPARLRIERAGTDEEGFLWVSGCLDLALPPEATATPLRLVYGPRVRLRLRTDGEVPAKPYQLQLSVRARVPLDSGEAGLREASPSAALKAWFRGSGGFPVAGWANPSISGSPEVEVHFSRPGAHHVRFMMAHVERSTSGTVTSSTPVRDADLTIDVQDGVADQTIDLEVPGSTLREALKSLGHAK